MRKIVLTLSFAICLLLCLTVKAEACSCDRRPNPPCSAYWETPVIFDGAVEKVTALNDGGYDRRLVRFSVESAYRGIIGKEVDVITGNGGSDCGYTFTEGKRYLVYAYGYGGQLETNYCTRTRPVEAAVEDLRYIRGLPDAPDGATIYGSVKKYAFGFGDDEDWGRTTPVKGIKISIEGPSSTLTAVTGRDGKYHLTGLPPGKYTIKALLPRTFELSVHDFAGGLYGVDIPNYGCAEASFRVQYQGRISGRMVDEKGLPVKGLKVDLLTADYKMKDGELVESLMDHDYTDEEGRFEFTGVPPGRYLVGVATIGTPEWRPPYPRVFYRNVSEPSAATILELKENEIKGINLRLGPKLIKQ